MRAALALLVLVLATGCATAKQTCEYYEDGTLESYSYRGAILGTGSTEVVATDCGVMAYSTANTGISDNGKESLGIVADAVIQGVVPQAAGGAVVERLFEDSPVDCEDDHCD